MEKKGNKVAMQSKHTAQPEIPFGKPARVGNYKVWRAKKVVGKGKDKVEIDQINISTLDESWQIKIPATFDMYGMIRELFTQMYSKPDGGGVSMLDRRAGQLTTLFGNMLYASCIANGYFQQAINMCATLYANPDLLKEEDKNHDVFMKDVKALVQGFLAWRKDYDAHVASNKPTEEDVHQEQVAEEMLDELEQQQEKADSDGDRA